jgi:hypothetical protein
MEEEEKLPEWVWCLVGNVVDEHEYGEDHRIVHGTKHFSPGTKVYVLPQQWDLGEMTPVVGRHRKSGKLICIVMRMDWIGNFRVQKVYSPNVIRHMRNGSHDGCCFRQWGDTEEYRREAEGAASWRSLTQEQKDRYWWICSYNRMTLTSMVAGDPDTRVVVRIEHRRSEGPKYGGAEYGFYSVGDGPETEVGMLSWYGAWKDVPEGKPHEEHGFSPQRIGIHLWDERYSSQPNGGGPPYSWWLEIECMQGTILICGENARPDALPQMYRYLAAFGFPNIWSSQDNAPSNLLETSG